MAKWIWIVAAMSMFVVSCGTDSKFAQEEYASEVYQFEPGDRYKCDIFPEKISKVASKYGKYINTNNTTARQRAYEVLTRLPEAHLDWVFLEMHVPVYITGLGGSGLAHYSNRNGFKTPTKVSSGVRGGGNWDAFPHEMGHTGEGFYQRQKSDFKSDLSNTYSQALRYERSGMRNYATQNNAEFFAEAYDQYYCSQEGRDAMRKKFPRTFGFMKKHMLPPPGKEVVPNETDKFTVDNQNPEFGICKPNREIYNKWYCKGVENGKTVYEVFYKDEWWKYIESYRIEKRVYATLQNLESGEKIYDINMYAIPKAKLAE